MAATASLIGLLAAASAHIEVLSPSAVAGKYEDQALGLTTDYTLTAVVAVSTSCPCDWLWAHPSEEVDALAGQMLLVPDGVCRASCSAAAVACAASLYNVSGLLLGAEFASGNFSSLPHPSDFFARPGWLFSERQAYARRVRALGCSGLPGSILSTNTSALLSDAVNWTVRVPLHPAAVVGAVLAMANESTHAGSNATTDPPLVPVGTADVWLDAIAAAAVNATAAWTTGVNATALNVTIRHRTKEPTIDCSKYTWAPLVYVATVPLWSALWSAWSWQTYQLGAAYATDLHRLMSWVPLMETVHGMLSLINYFSCPWESLLSLVSATFWSILTILKEPILLLCLLLVAKGWCVTRHVLRRREVLVAGTLLALLYASVSLQMSLQSAVAEVPMVVMYGLVLLEILASILANLLPLRRQMHALRALDVTQVVGTPVHTKYVMFQQLGVIVLLYAALEATIHSLFNHELHEHSFHWFLACHQAMELLIAALVGYTFRPRPFAVPPQQSAAVAAELADLTLPAIVTVELAAPEGLAEKAASLIALRAPPLAPTDKAPSETPPTLLVLNPGDADGTAGIELRSLRSSHPLAELPMPALEEAHLEPPARAAAVDDAVESPLLEPPAAETAEPSPAQRQQQQQQQQQQQAPTHPAQ